MPSDWKKFENENGFPYYINESVNIKQWDHPKYQDVVRQLDECNYIKHSTYRIAAKLRVLQQAFYMDEIQLTTILGIFERHKLGATEGALYLESCDLEAVLSDIYFASNKQNYTNTDIDFATELFMNFLYNIYDKDRRDNVQVSSTKLVLAIISKCSISDLFNLIFTLCSDHNNCVTKLKLKNILNRFSKITTYLHEDANFGSHLINDLIENCFNNIPGLVGISEGSFKSWISTYPSLFSWIPTLHRIKSAESMVHNIKCSCCKTLPFTGLRYKCLKCSNYTQCQHCFLSGKSSHAHKLTHPVKEYCKETNPRVFTNAFVKKIYKLLKLIPIKNNALGEAKILSFNKSCLTLSSNTETSSNIQPLSSPDVQLQVVISQLELENRQLEQLVISNPNDLNLKDYLREHRLQIITQIQKLKTLKECIKRSNTVKINEDIPKLKRIQSTPLITNDKFLKKSLAIDMLSPINQENVCRNFDSTYNISNICNNNTKYTADNKTLTENNFAANNSLSSYSIKDISTWIGGCPSASTSDIFEESDLTYFHEKKSTEVEKHNNLDEVLAKLQQILDNNITLDDSLCSSDNGHLKNTVNEVEGMLTCLIDEVENNKKTHESNYVKSSDGKIYN